MPRTVRHWPAVLAGLRPRGAVVWFIAVAVAVRALCAATVPLIITNDSVWYFKWAREILSGEPVDWPPIRTPGYPLFLAAVFKVCGVSSCGVLAAQHVLGCVVVGLLAAIAARVSGRAWCGLAIGVLAALDPVSLGLESYALSEPLATLLLVLCAAFMILPRRRSWAALIGLGASLAALCLVRPAFQVMAPFIVAGVALGLCKGRQWQSPIAAIAVVSAAFLSVLGPWLVYNRERGFVGLIASNAVILWVGVAESGLLADDYPLPADVRGEYERLVKPAPQHDAHVMQMVSNLNAWTDAGHRKVLTRWAEASLVASPRRYAAAAFEALMHQLGWFPAWASFRHDETRWMLWRLSQDGRKYGNRWANFNISGEPWDVDRFAMGPPRGPMRNWFGWWSRRGWLWLPRVALASCAAAAAGMLLRRRRWPEAMLLLGSLAYVAVHAAFLLTVSRYSAPCWTLWWVAPASLVGVMRARRGANQPTSAETAGSQEMPDTSDARGHRGSS